MSLEGFRTLLRSFTLKMIFLGALTDDCTKDGGDKLFTKMHCCRIRVFNDSLGIRLKNAVHLG